MRILCILLIFYVIACSSAKEKDEKAGERAISTIISRANKGDTAAQFTLGFKYYFGDEVRQDKDSSKYWLGKAADAGHVKAKSTHDAFFKVIPTLNGDTLK